MKGWLTITLQGKVTNLRVTITEGKPTITQTWIAISGAFIKYLTGQLSAGFSNIFSSSETMKEKFKEIFDRDEKKKYTVYIKGILPLPIETGDVIDVTFDREISTGIVHRVFKDDSSFFLTPVLFPYRISKIKDDKEVASVNIQQKEIYHHNWIRKQREGYPY